LLAKSTAEFFAKLYILRFEMTEASTGHSFYIPVMGTGFTIDTPLKVAKYGISSVISLVDDVLIEQMREFHSKQEGKPFEPIGKWDEDARARRITLYLNFMNELIQQQVETLKAAPFSGDSEIDRYFKLLPEGTEQSLYLTMLAETDPRLKKEQQERLRSMIVTGTIDVNIMTKLDAKNFRGRTELAEEFRDAQAALRGFALSDVRASIIFSAGMNQRLYTYISQFDDFFPDETGERKKQVVLKVSDYRSAEIQGKFMAKRGVWVSEYRFESGLNCGGHAFASTGYLMGPILEEFVKLRESLIEKLFVICNKALTASGRDVMKEHPPVRFTAQGGIGTAEENELILKQYQMDATGWGTPFLLVPEATSLDDGHIAGLIAAEEKDVFLSESSPLGIPFWNLRRSASEEARRKRIAEGKPGSLCPKGFLVSNTDFSEKPICLASQAYQRAKLKKLGEADWVSEDRSRESAQVLVKSCICHELAGGALLKNKIDSEITPAVCCGPNIVNFSRIATLEEMIGHIYGRCNLITRTDRPHAFARELKLYIDYLRKELDEFSQGLSNRKQKYFDEYRKNLRDGIEYYRQMPEFSVEADWIGFLEELRVLAAEVDSLAAEPVAAV
jgi:hypothetical protein